MAEPETFEEVCRQIRSKVAKNRRKTKSQAMDDMESFVEKIIKTAQRKHACMRDKTAEDYFTYGVKKNLEKERSGTKQAVAGPCTFEEDFENIEMELGEDADWTPITARYRLVEKQIMKARTQYPFMKDKMLKDYLACEARKATAATPKYVPPPRRQQRSIGMSSTSKTLQ